MKKTILILSVLFSLTSFAAENPYKALKTCLHSLADAPTTPAFPNELFKKIGNEEVFSGWCYTVPDVNEYFSYMFLTDTGVKALKFPFYHFTNQGNPDYLPGDIMHFKYDGKDYYASPRLGGESLYVTSAELPVVVDDLMTTMTRVMSQIKRYEDYLKKNNLMSYINVSSDPVLVESVMPCLAKHEMDTIETYQYGKFKNFVPALGYIREDTENYPNLSDASKARYKMPFEEMKSVVVKDLLASHPLCVGVMEEAKSDLAFENFFGENRELYEALRKKLYPATLIQK